MYTYRKIALRVYSYGVVAELHRASRTPGSIEIYIGIESGRQIPEVGESSDGVAACNESQVKHPRSRFEIRGAKGGIGLADP
jgi:hypothetical protein